MRFVDLFSGLGGFHVGLKNNGHECVFSCEIDSNLRELYRINHGIMPHDDIRTVDETKVPAHDILCAGFPCQPFSLAGKKKGSECPTSGRLIDHVIRIANYHHPKFVLLENVPNILTIANGSFWKYLNSSFENIGYKVDYKIISPVDLGIPQNRKRIFILCTRKDVDSSSFKWPDASNEKIVEIKLRDVLDSKFEHKQLEVKKIELLKHWQELLYKLELDNLSCISLVAPEFGASYPYDFSKLSLNEMRLYKGAYGQSLSKCKTWKEVIDLLPSYAQKECKTPQWIMKSAQFSREIYKKQREVCDNWSSGLDKNNNSWQILEWRGNHTNHNIYEHLIQFRASGIRIMNPDIAPSLIAMTPTQIPIIPSESRYISKYEAAKLQNLHLLKNLPTGNNAAFKALGNAVNAKLVELVSKSLH